MISMILVVYFPASDGAWSHDLSTLESPVMLPRSAPMILPLHPRSAPMRLPLHPRSACPQGSPNCLVCCVSCWVICMPWTVLRPSFRSCQVEPLSCTSRCALPNSRLRAGCQCLRCRIPWQPLFSSAYAPDEFSCLTWTFHRQANVRQQSALPIFLWRTYSRTNLRCRFLPLLA